MAGNQAADLLFSVGAGEGNRTLMTSLEGWGSAIELRPRARRPVPSGEHRQRTRTERSAPNHTAGGLADAPPIPARGKAPCRTPLRDVGCSPRAVGYGTVQRDVAQLG
jgi:hypothetical protein